MRRALVAFLVLPVAALVVTGLGACGGGDDSYRVDAIFQNAKGMVSGQLVKVAGTRVGKVVDVDLARGSRARIELELDDEFSPFHSDATCKILPEGFISENYVQCDPGNRSRPVLAEGESGEPTVPLQQTSIPVNLQDVVNIFTVPVSQRLRLFVNEIGIGTAGRGEDFNAIVRRANPALTQANRVLSIIDGQREEVADAVGQTDQVLAELARRRRQVRQFVGRSADVAVETATHREALGRSVRSLPPLLDSLRNALGAVDRVTEAGTPLLRDLQRSGPGLLTLTRELPAFSRSGATALRALGTASVTGRRAVKSARPFIRNLREVATQLQKSAPPLARTLASARDGGFFEEVLRLFYALSTDTGSYDSVSHVITIFAGVYGQCYANVRAPGCSHAFNQPGQGTVPVNAPQLGPQLGPLSNAGGEPVQAASTAAAGRSEPRRKAVTPEDAEKILSYLLGDRDGP